jgi:hypothetical protein
MNDISKYRAGRPPGARNRFSGQFLSDLAEAWAEHGKDALNIMAKEEPSKFVVACASLLPRDVLLTIDREPGPLDSLSPAEMRGLLETVRAMQAKMINGTSERQTDGMPKAD